MFGFRNRERELYERLLAEKDRTIVALADEVDWHRAHSGTYTTNHLTTPQTALADQDLAMEQILTQSRIGDPDAQHLSEDEEELLWQVQHAGVDPSMAAAALAQINAANAQLPFDPD